MVRVANHKGLLGAKEERNNHLYCKNHFPNWTYFVQILSSMGKYIFFILVIGKRFYLIAFKTKHWDTI